MIFGSPRRIFRSRILRLALVIVVVWTFLEAFYIHRGILLANNGTTQHVNREKIFIAFLPWNQEIILRTHLMKQIKELIQALGVENVFLSIYENGSFDNTKDALRDLQRELDDMGARSQMTMEATSHQDIVNGRPTKPEEGWIEIDSTGYEKHDIRKGDFALRRIYYLAGLRNKVFKPFDELARQGEKFDKILFLNDVVYSAEDILNLLHTRDGKYAAACTLDFEVPPAFYDTFALRDSEGYPALMLNWPFFRSAASRNALIANHPVPVKSCWNGIVAMNAQPFYDEISPLRFRAVPDTLAHHHIEGSECCLIHADNRLSKELGNWINPNVRVGYCHPGLHKNQFQGGWDLYSHVCQMAYDYVHPSTGTWVSHWQIAKGLWENRIRRMTSMGWMQNWKARRKADAWERESEGNEEIGKMCLIDEMQVIEPLGWLHV